MTQGAWRRKCGPAGVGAVCAGSLAYAGKLMANRNFIASHPDTMGTWAEIGFLLGIVGVILGFLTPDKKFKTPVLVGSMMVLIVWFCDIAWSAVMK